MDLDLQIIDGNIARHLMNEDDCMTAVAEKFNKSRGIFCFNMLVCFSCMR